ncbi:hypothetical protein C922_05204, partial [Plasmodium inui San Antonio 1]
TRKKEAEKDKRGKEGAYLKRADVIRRISYKVRCTRGKPRNKPGRRSLGTNKIIADAGGSLGHPEGDRGGGVVRSEEARVLKKNRTNAQIKLETGWEEVAGLGISGQKRFLNQN